jgi:hypothetical protein
MGGLAMLLGASGGWLSHAVGRHEDRPFLMPLTVMHQLGVAVSQGCIIQLGLLWRLVRRQPDEKRLWPLLLRRTSEGGPAGVGAHWSDYNHNVLGLFIVIMALLELASQARRVPWAHHWLLGFVAVGVGLILLFYRETPVSSG